MKKINKNVIFISLIILSSIISYTNIFFNDFVWDDIVFITENQEIKSISNIPAFFTKDSEGTYRPLRSTYYSLIYSIAKTKTFFYHLNSIILHTIISVLVFLIIKRLLKNKDTALIASLIFTVHPIHTGRVTNMTAGFDLPGILLLFLSFYLYILFSESKKKKYFVFSILFFISGLSSSEEAVIVPFLIILYEFCLNKKKFLDKKDWITKYSYYFVFLIAYLFIRFFLINLIGRVPDYESPGIIFTMMTMVKVVIKYMILLIAPLNLKLYYDVPIVRSFFEIGFLISLVIIISIIIIAIRKFNKILLFSTAWFFISLLPFLNILPIVVLMAERYLYVPSFGFCLLLGYLINRIKNKKVVITISLLVIIIFSSLTIERNSQWKDNITLWTETVKDAPYSSRAHDNLGYTLEQMGRYEDASLEFSKAVELKPDNYKALANLGVALAKLGKINESIERLESAVDIKPDHYNTYNKLGLVYAMNEEYKPALFNLMKAVKLNPHFAKGYNDVGTVYGRLGEFDSAEESFQKAIEIDYYYADAHFNLGILYEFLGKDSLAREEIQTAYILEPDNKLYKDKLKN